MPNFLEMLRLKNVFGTPDMASVPVGGSSTPMMPPAGDFADSFKGKSPFENMSFGQPQMDFSKPPSGPTMSGAPVQPEFDPAKRMAELYSPETVASDRFNQLASSMPEYEKPGVWRSIAAALSAFGPGGHDVGFKVARQPYEEKMARWKEQIGPAQQAASLERYNNANERTLAHQTVQGELTARRDEARAKSTEEQNRIRADRAEVYRFKTMNPNMKFDFSGPTVKVANPATGQVTDTGLATGSLSDADKAALNQKNALERIDTQAGYAEDLEDKRQGGRETLQEGRMWQPFNLQDGTAVLINTQTGATKPLEVKGPIAKPSGAGSNRGELPTQTKVRQFNTAKQFASNNPELARFIKFGKSNEFTITPPSDGGFFSSVGPTPEQHAQINQAIFGGDIPITQPTRTNTVGEAKPTPTAKPTTPTVEAPPKGAKPGGKWVDTKFGRVYVEP